MKAEIKFVKTKDFIKTTASGQLSLDQSKKVLKEIAKLNTPDDIHDILVDIRDTISGLSLSDIYELVTEVGNHRQAFRKKIAILLGSQHDIDKARFLEMCASNRGYNVNAFDDFEEAVNWLMCEDDD
ncbi:MAG TPA: hypothetical protein PKE39_05500 [Ignavibacteria bacterium]|nr:hypothetical protein [Ignavibacteria bacterium]HMQ98458.1 hypothetical protein [Ignavibacteria bacterium]